MAPRLRLAAAALGALAFGTGCATAIVAAPKLLGRDTPPHYAFHTAREKVEAKLGKPIELTPLPDGGHVATYRYRRQEGTVNKVGEGVVVAEFFSFLTPELGGPFLWLLLQPVLIPTAIGAAIHAAANPAYGTVTFTYGPYDDLLYVGSPPPYGPPDDALGQPSLGTLRKSCWGGAEGESAGRRERAGDDRSYVECLARRFALWGIE